MLGTFQQPHAPPPRVIHASYESTHPYIVPSQLWWLDAKPATSVTGKIAVATVERHLLSGFLEMIVIPADPTKVDAVNQRINQMVYTDKGIPIAPPLMNDSMTSTQFVRELVKFEKKQLGNLSIIFLSFPYLSNRSVSVI
jgi:hypothetical protein